MSKEIQPIYQFEGIRRKWREERREYWYAVVDVIEVLAETKSPSRYWNELRSSTKSKSGIELFDFCEKLPMKSRKNNRTYRTDCANPQGLLRIIQSIPSPGAEPFKQWLAKTGSRRLKEIQNDPIEREREKYRLQGYDENWINTRLESQGVRNELTDEWRNRGVSEGHEFGILTNEIHKGTFDEMSVKDHKEHKDLKKGDSLRDHMTPIELAFTILGEASTIEEIKQNDPKGFEENRDSAKKGGKTAGKLREVYEEETGRPVISDQSYIEERRRLLAARDEEAADTDDEKDEEGES